MTDDGDSPNKIVEETNDEGIVTSYKCDYHVKSGAISRNNSKEINSYYEMLLPCREDSQDAMNIVASELLDSLGTTFGLLPDGSACTVPDTSLDAWVIGESSSPDDSVVPHMDCTKLSAGDNDELCCVIVKAPMTFWVGKTSFNDESVMKYAAAVLNSGALTYQTAYTGSMIEYSGNAGQDQIPSPTTFDDDVIVSGIGQTPSTNPKDDKPPISLLGGFLMAALIVAVVLVVAAITFRRRKQKRADDIACQQAKADRDSLEFIKDDDSIGPTLEMDRLSDDMLQQHVMVTNSSFGLDDKVDDPEYQQNYTFDIADSMKHHIMGQYGGGGRGNFGPTSMAVYPPYHMEETSDSEADDSWAQTEGTVGSLEENLEQITAEI